jgi:poly(3-hydroxybutyrate) depolymerase
LGSRRFGINRPIRNHNNPYSDRIKIVMRNLRIHTLLQTVMAYVLLQSAAAFAGQSVNITVGSTSRNILVHAPSGIAKGRPLMIAMHGRGLTAASHETESKLNPIADAERFVVIYPTGIDNSWDLSGTRDIDFLVAIINYAANTYGSDRNRVYLSGFSMGGMMTYYAATKIADRIAALAPISGYLLGGPNTNSSRPLPLIHTHGRNDNVVSYSGVQTCIDAWVRRNGCPTTAQVTDPYPSSKPTSYCARYYYGPGTNGVAVVLLALRDKGHWIATDSDKGINTSQEIWNFCKNYSLGRYDAESATLAGGAVTESTNSGYVGSGYVNFPANSGTATFNNVVGNGGGVKNLSIRYALGATSARTGNITVNGATKSVTFQSTGAWTTWGTLTVNVTLNNNTTNTISFASTGSDLANIDQITVP